MRPPKSSGGGGGGRSHDNYDRGGNQQGGYGNSYTTESTFVIPADKCGLVIGKGEWALLYYTSQCKLGYYNV